MRPLRLTPLWQVLSFLLLAAAVYLSLGPAGAVRGAWILPLDYDDKLGHFLAYLILTLWFCGLYRRSRFFVVAPALLLLGIAMEFLQETVANRQMDIGDIYANSGGIALGMLLALVGFDRWCTWLENRVLRPAGGTS